MRQKRVEKLREWMTEQQLSAIVVTDPFNQQYVSGFKALIYSRPIYFVITSNETVLIVPGLEEVHAHEHAAVDRIYVYYEHPEKEDQGIDAGHALIQYLKPVVQGGKIGVEFHSTTMKLERTLLSVTDQLVDISAMLLNQRAIKDAGELEGIRQAGKLVSLALSESLASVRVGISEMEIDHHGNMAVFQRVSEQYTDANIDNIVMSPSGIARTLFPHVFSNTRKLEKGDVVIHSRQVSLNGYRAECERTFFVGQPTERQKEAFEVMAAAQKAALDVMRAGVSMKNVDAAARSIIQHAGYGDYAIHRTGHSIGLAPHEAPSVRFDEEALLQEGMVFAIEPGFYVPHIGGFRHSDTIIVKKDGYEMVTDYPRSFEDLILDATHN